MASTQVRSMTVGPLEIRWTVNLGQILMVLGMVAGGVVAWFELQNEVASVKQTAQQLGGRFDRHEIAIASDLLAAQARIGRLEVANAKTETQLDNIAAMVARILEKLDAR